LRRRRRIFALLGVFLILTGTCPVFAAGLTTFRDGNIEFNVPNEWTFDEFSVETDKYDKYEVEQIIDAYPSEGDTWLYVYYIAEKTANVYDGSFVGSEGTALGYYEEYGKPFIEWYFNEHWAIPNVKVSEPVYFSGEWENYIYVDIEYTGGGETCKLRGYLTASGYSAAESIVHIFQLYELGTTDDVSLSETIADGFDDYDYGEVLCGIRTLDEDWEANDDSDEEDGAFDFLMTFAVPIIIAIVSIIAKIKGENDDIDENESEEDPFEQIAEKVRQREVKQAERKAAKQQKKAEKQLATGALEKTKEKRFVFKKAVDDRELFKERSAKPGQKRAAAPVRKTTTKRIAEYELQAEQRYIASLETLRKSGLLTKEEMQEMIDKHRRL